MRRIRTWAIMVPVTLTLGACDLRERPAGMVAGRPVIPSVVGYAEGEEILFIHTEASDPEIADTLTAKMRFPSATTRGRRYSTTPGALHEIEEAVTSLGFRVQRAHAAGGE